MKPQINKILYATDLSKNSAHAFYFASDLAKKENARIVFLHCMGMTSPAAYLAAGFTDVPSLLKSAKEVEARKDVLEIKRRLTEFGRQVGSKMASSEPRLRDRCDRGLSGRRDPRHCGGEGV